MLWRDERNRFALLSVEGRKGGQVEDCETGVHDDVPTTTAATTTTTTTKRRFQFLSPPPITYDDINID
jgi:hypothetical protein